MGRAGGEEAGGPRFRLRETGIHSLRSWCNSSQARSLVATVHGVAESDRTE